MEIHSIFEIYVIYMFKENLKIIRQTRNLSQKQLANLVNVSFQTISHWESGYTEPSIEQIKKLIAILDSDYEELLS